MKPWTFPTPDIVRDVATWVYAAAPAVLGLESLLCIFTAIFALTSRTDIKGPTRAAEKYPFEFTAQGCLNWLLYTQVSFASFCNKNLGCRYDKLLASLGNCQPVHEFECCARH